MKNSINQLQAQKAQNAFEEKRALVFKGDGAASIHQLSDVELLNLQTLLGLGENWGVLVFPKAWMAPGSLSRESSRTVDIRGSFRKASVRIEDEELAIRTVVRATLLSLATPVFNARYAQYLKPSSVCSNARTLVDIAIEASRLPATLDGNLLARLPKPVKSNGEKQKRQRIELERFARFAERGLWSDVPSESLALSAPPSPAGDRVVPIAPPRKKPYLPINDKFLAEAGYRVAWVVETLGPSLLRCGQGIHEIRKAYPLSQGIRQTQRWRRTELSKEFLKDFNWLAPHGNPIVSLPFPMHFSGMGKGGKFSWPPRTLSQARMLLRVLQSSHLFVSLLSTGGRISEILSLQPGSVTESADGIALANGRTYKLSVLVEGRRRDWPLPAIAVQSIKQQEELAALAIPDEDEDEDEDEDDDEGDGKEELSAGEKDEEEPFVDLESIWTREGGSGQRIDGEYNKYLRNVVKIFGLTEEFGEGNLHAHRFRKSVARLIALAIVGAPKILMDLFGHKQIGMTLHYILADPTIRAEMLEVARAQTIMLAKTAISQVDDCGGPAAKNLQSSVKAEQLRMGSDFGEETLEALAETLTINGRYWQLVRPGVLCTKGPQVAGACTPSTAMPEPSRCRSSCDHRLELAFLKDDVDKSIAFAVNELQQAVSEEDEVKAEMWRGQILANIGRFEVLREKWVSHPAIGDLLRHRNEGVA
jgi:integrase